MVDQYVQPARNNIEQLSFSDIRETNKGHYVSESFFFQIFDIFFAQLLYNNVGIVSLLHSLLYPEEKPISGDHSK